MPASRRGLAVGCVCVPAVGCIVGHQADFVAVVGCVSAFYSAAMSQLQSIRNQIASRLERVRERIAAAAARRQAQGKAGGVPASQVRIVTVTKYASVAQVEALLALGHRDLGENRVPQFIERAERFTAPTPASADGEPIRWHMVGHLQRNKARNLLPWMALLHSLDSLRLVEELEKQIGREGEAAAAGKLPPTLPSGRRAGAALDVLVQVNVSGESTKSGVTQDELWGLVERTAASPRLNLRGLMTMAPYAPAPGSAPGSAPGNAPAPGSAQVSARPVFAQAAELFNAVGESGLAGADFDILSMGMSGDFEVAVEEGATMVRIGSLLFEPQGGS